jgi:hypothetical protein
VHAEWHQQWCPSRVLRLFNTGGWRLALGCGVRSERLIPYDAIQSSASEVAPLTIVCINSASVRKLNKTAT